jgi:hypothetical protein
MQYLYTDCKDSFPRKFLNAKRASNETLGLDTPHEAFLHYLYGFNSNQLEISKKSRFSLKIRNAQSKTL